jgi:hypothetical protein
MLIIGSKQGQLGNRLLLFAHFIANALEYGYEVWNPSFYDYAKYFEGTRHDFFCRFPARKTRINGYSSMQGALYYMVFYPALRYHRIGLGNALIRVLNIWQSHDKHWQNYDLASEEFIRLRKNTRITIVQGWLFRDYINFAKHGALLREFFTPVELHVRNVARLISKARRDCDVLVGAHIRQGDYASFLGGRFYFGTRQYVDLFNRAIDLWRGKRVKFLICSNAPQDRAVLKSLNYMLGNNHLVEDMYALAQCDYLIGPPSTYTMWASFYGAVPLLMIDTVNAPVIFSRFQVYKG